MVGIDLFLPQAFLFGLLVHKGLDAGVRIILRIVQRLDTFDDRHSVKICVDVDYLPFGSLHLDVRSDLAVVGQLADQLPAFHPCGDIIPQISVFPLRDRPENLLSPASLLKRKGLGKWPGAVIKA